jgi:hypothetical protein
LADLIIDMHLGHEQIARVFTVSASKGSARELVVIISAGSIARYKANPKGWSGAACRLNLMSAHGRQT